MGDVLNTIDPTHIRSGRQQRRLWLHQEELTIRSNHTTRGFGQAGPSMTTIRATTSRSDLEPRLSNEGCDEEGCGSSTHR
uniref:Uncharacterized protein n=1 Tax=Oryza sativa subsp. japonica TaxID=39947 RepID=Q6H4Q7_ORYSJ|nr:hypothetical protein [Oryza sativa Japonica Group]BAD26292.1 hypothetical protein [Oryza sativa Japonica Group]